MATRAATRSSPRQNQADWRVALRHSVVRAAQVTGAVLLFAAAAFLALALVSYHQTDPSWSTAAGGPVANWMGGTGAFVADRALIAFGFVSALFVPLIALFGRKLWRDGAIRNEAAGSEAPGDAERALHWWRTSALLLVAMVLLATVAALVTDPLEWDLPAAPGGLAGLLGQQGIDALARLAPPRYTVWATLGLGLVALVGGALLAARVFALDWAQLLSAPRAMRRRRAAAADDEQTPASPFAQAQARQRAPFRRPRSR